MPDTEDGKPSDAPIKDLRSNWWTGFVSYIERKAHERRTKYENETPPDRAARLTTRATVWMAIFTAVLAFVGIATYCVLKNQFVLTRQELEGTMRAIVTLGVGAELERSLIEVTATNEGHVAATDVHFELQVIKMSVPDLRPVGNAVPINTRIPLLAVQQNPDRPEYPFPVSPEERDAIDNNFDLVIKTEGTLTYNDGFGIWRENICRIRFAFRIMNNGQPQEGFSGAAAACEEFKKALPSLLADKRNMLKRAGRNQGTYQQPQNPN